MPRYFFDFTDGELDFRDRLGTKLPDLETAACEAVVALANISKDVRKRYGHRDLGLDVRDQNGETVFNVRLTLAVTWPSDRQISSAKADDLSTSIMETSEGQVRHPVFKGLREDGLLASKEQPGAPRRLPGKAGRCLGTINRTEGDAVAAIRFNFSDTRNYPDSSKT